MLFEYRHLSRTQYDNLIRLVLIDKWYDHIIVLQLNILAQIILRILFILQSSIAWIVNLIQRDKNRDNIMRKGYYIILEFLNNGRNGKINFQSNLL